jgi:ABC-type dipeptide/oligopeptide/nickel transport system permease component
VGSGDATVMGGRHRRFVLRRLAIVPGSLLLVVLVSFLLVALIPQDTALAIAGQGASTATVDALRHKLGIDEPLGTQLVRYLDRLGHGNLGTSYYNGKKVLPDMLSHVPTTLELVLPALVIGVGLGLAFGVIGAYYAGRRADRAVRATGSVLQAMPEFLVGLLLLYVFFFRLHLLPAPTGQLGVAYLEPPHHTGFLVIDSIIAGQWSTLSDVLAHLVLPVLTIALPLAAVLARVTRSVVGPALSETYTDYGRAVGLRERRVVLYALIDARTSLMTLCAAIFAGIVGGDAIVEIVFNWNGVGQWAITAITNLDVPQIQGFVLFSSIVTLFVYIALDVASSALDPRIRLDHAR